MKKNEVKEAVREGYAKIAKEDSSCCSPTNSCCGGTDLISDISKKLGYTEQELKAVPEGANLGLGCGNPVALASLREGETVLDLGSGAGFDCFLASKKVGKNGKVIGVDTTPEMIERAKQNAKKGGHDNVEFRLGDIEKLPVPDNSVDIVISNCVINLSPDKGKVFRESFRALKPGGRIMISDIVLTKELPDFIKNSVEAYIGCISGAMLKDKYIDAIKAAGFQKIEVVDEVCVPAELWVNDPTAKAIIEYLKIPPEKVKETADSVVSMKVHAVKPE